MIMTQQNVTYLINKYFTKEQITQAEQRAKKRLVSIKPCRGLEKMQVQEAVIKEVDMYHEKPMEAKRAFAVKVYVSVLPWYMAYRKTTQLLTDFDAHITKRSSEPLPLQ